MKRLKVLFAVLGALLLSCESGPMLRDNCSIIHFSLVRGSLSIDTRTLYGSSEQSLRSGGFDVCALRYSGQLYYKDRASWNGTYGFFETESVNYWPESEPLSFFACYPGGESFRYSADGPVVEYSQDEPVDLIGASVFAAIPGQPVGLYFCHLLSRVRINAVPDCSGVEYSLSGLRLEVPSSGLYSFFEGRWIPGAVAEYDFEGDEMLLLPGEAVLHVAWECSQEGKLLGSFSDSISLELDSGVFSDITLIMPPPGNGKLDFTVQLSPWEERRTDVFERFFEGTASGDFTVSIIRKTGNVTLESVNVSPDGEGCFRTFLPELPDGCHYMFNSARNATNGNLTSITQLPYVLSRDGTFESMFINCSALVSVCGFVQDPGSIVSMENMFLGCECLETLPPLDMRSCRNAMQMFYSCSSLPALDLSDTGQVTNFQSAFQYCSSLETLPALDLGSCGNCSGMFFGCSALRSISLSDTGGVSVFRMAFTDCASLESLSALDLSSCTDCSSMFLNCANLSSVELRNTGAVSSFNIAFRACTSLRTLSPLDLSSCRNCSGMFFDCSSLETLQMENTGSVNSFYMAFTNCTSLESLSALDLSSCTDCNSMFLNCANLSSVELRNTGAVSSFNIAFRACTSLRTLSPLDLSSCRNCSGMFFDCSSLETLQMENTGSVNSFYMAFTNCTSLESLSALDLSSCTDCSSMFLNCAELESLVLRNTGMAASFYNCFNGCSALESISLLDFASCGNCSGMFTGCTSLRSCEGFANVGIPLHVANRSSSGLEYTVLDRESVLSIFDGLLEMEGAAVMLSAASFALLGAEDMAVAEAKGWSVTS